MLKFYRQEERRGRIDAFDFAASQVSTARFDVIDPEVESGFVGLAAQEVEIVLADEVLGGIQRIHRGTGKRAGKDRLSLCPQLAKASLGWTEAEVGPRRRHHIEAVRLDVVKAIVALRIGNSNASSCLITYHDDCDIRNWQTGVLICDFARKSRSL